MASDVAQGIVVIGQFVPGGVVCPLVRLSDGRTVAVTGLPHDLRQPGVRLRLTGRFVEHSVCQQGEGTFQASEARRV